MMRGEGMTQPTSTSSDFWKKTRERMEVYLKHPPENRAEEVRKLGRSETTPKSEQETQQKPSERRFPRFSPEQHDRLLDSYKREQEEIDEYLRRKRGDEKMPR